MKQTLEKQLGSVPQYKLKLENDGYWLDSGINAEPLQQAIDNSLEGEIIAQAGIVRRLQKQYFSMARAEPSRYKSKDTKAVFAESKKQEIILDEMLDAYNEIY